MTMVTSYLYIVQNAVRELRTNMGLSQAELGAALSVSRQTINAIEAGRYLPSLPLALSLGRFFSTAVEKMFTLDDEPEESSDASSRGRSSTGLMQNCNETG